jgi:hypothetical protein
MNSEFEENPNQIPDNMRNILPVATVVFCHDHKTKRYSPSTTRRVKSRKLNVIQKCINFLCCSWQVTDRVSEVWQMLENGVSADWNERNGFRFYHVVNEFQIDLMNWLELLSHIHAIRETDIAWFWNFDEYFTLRFIANFEWGLAFTSNC